MFTLGKFNFQLDENASEDNGYLMFTIYKRNLENDNNVHNINLLIHSKTYELEPFFFYYANNFGHFKSCITDVTDSSIWYLGEDIEGWKFALPKADRISECYMDCTISRDTALTLLKVVCTIRDNYDEFVKKMDKEIVELQL